MYRHSAVDSAAAGSRVCAKQLLTAEDIDPRRQDEAKAYARLKHRLLVADMALGGGFAVLLLVTGISAWMTGGIEAFLTQPVLVVGAYFLVFSLAYGLLLLPLEYYGGFVLPHRYGLSTQTKRGWVADQAKAGVLSLALGVVVVEVMYFLLRSLPSLWWLVTAVFMLLVTVILTNVAPLLIVPLFFKLTPVGDEELVARLTRLAERAKTKVKGVFTINLSSRTKAGNAMLMGLGSTRRIVLGDTLYSDYGPDEIESILAHELGHQVRHDMWWGLILQSTLTLVGLYLAHVVLGWGVRVMGFAGLDDVAGLPLLALVMGAFMAVSTPVINGFSRWREGMADEFALQMTGRPEAFVSVMVKLANQNLAQVDPERWVELLLYSHPAMMRRIQHGENYRARAPTLSGGR
ncbi:MAG: M48 family metalloprotease [Anaerolineae bacterium]|nr:M48 family metalloprotease [Anaerolineae bacterium]NIN98865.1 M48 family metalloprotease [Anaerolineae bacterium]NIQ81776.1 M48 family metalloprotease [Anaerolineae bacterium]